MKYINAIFSIFVLLSFSDSFSAQINGGQKPLINSWLAESSWLGGHINMKTGLNRLISHNLPVILGANSYSNFRKGIPTQTEQPKESTTDTVEYCVTKPISNIKVLPDSNWSNFNCKKKVIIDMAIGEYEPASFILKSKKSNIENVNLVVQDFVRSDGVKISAENIDIKIVKVWYQSEGAWGKHWRVSKKPVLVPELLLNDDELILVDTKKKKNYIKINVEGETKYKAAQSIKDEWIIPNKQFPIRDASTLMPFKLKENRNKQVWVTMKIPNIAMPGNYKSTIKVHSFEKTLVEIDFEINVLPFKLDSPKLEFSLYYRGTLAPEIENDKGYISSELKSKQQLRAELINMKTHGVNNATVYQRLHLKNRNDLDRLALEKLEQYLTMRQDVGIKDKPLYYLGRLMGLPKTQQGIDQINVDIKLLRYLTKKYGFKQLYLYGVDEAKGQVLIDQKKIWNIAKQQGVKILAAGYSGHTKKLKELTNILVYQGKEPRKEALAAHEFDNLIYSYANPQVGVENPAIYRRNYGYKLWKDDFDGVMNYAYQHSMGFAWNDFDHKKYRDHNFTYPTVDGVIDTIAWEGFREAVDDIRYLTTLINLIDNKVPNYITRKAAIYLKKIKNEEFTKDSELIRKEIISHIISIVQ